MAENVRVVDHSAEIIDKLQKQLFAATEAVGLHLEGEAKEELENDPRRIDTGRLRNSITHDTEVENIGVSTTIGTDVEYAYYVHDGTRKMAPNRFLINALNRNMKQIVKFLMEKVKL